MSGTQRPPAPYVYDPGQAWDELYDTLDGKAALPPPPVSPRRRRARRRIMGIVLSLVVLAGAAAGVISVAVRQVTAIINAIAAADVAVLQDRVDWPGLHRDLRDQLTAMARAAQAGSLHGAAPDAATGTYLAGLIDVTIAGLSGADGLARTLRQRAVPGDAAMIAGAGGGQPEIGAVSLTAGPALMLQLPGDASAFPSGVGLCLRLLDGGALRVRLFGLTWPEFTRPC